MGAKQSKLLFDAYGLRLTIARLCEQLIERYASFEDVFIIGLQPRGIYLAQRLVDNLRRMDCQGFGIGFLDVTFHRAMDKQAALTEAHETTITQSVTGLNVLLVDDVLYTGKTVRAAMDAVLAYGTPKCVELLVLVDRQNGRLMPIEANYVGRYVCTLSHEHVVLHLKEQGTTDGIWLKNFGSKT